MDGCIYIYILYMESRRRFDDEMMLVIGIIIYMIKDRSGRINERERKRERG